MQQVPTRTKGADVRIGDVLALSGKAVTMAKTTRKGGVNLFTGSGVPLTVPADQTVWVLRTP